MRTIAKCATVAALCALLAGCSTWKLNATLPDGTVIIATHRNFYHNRKMTGETPEGFKFTSEVDNKDATIVVNNIVDRGAPIAKAAAGGL